MTSGIKLTTIFYCAIYFLLYQEFFNLCVCPQCITEFSTVSAISQLNCTYCHNIFIAKQFLMVLDIFQCIKYYLYTTNILLILLISAITLVSAIVQFCLFLFTISIIYQNLGVIISPCMLESATHLSLVLLLDRYSYQLPIQRSSFSVVIVSGTSLNYFYDDEFFSWYS